MHGHQVDGVERFEDRVRLVARRQRIEVIGNARERGVAAVLNAADEAAHLLDVLPRLLAPSAAQLVGVGRVGDELLDQIRGRNAIHPREPRGHVAARLLQRRAGRRRRATPGGRRLGAVNAAAARPPSAPRGGQPGRLSDSRTKRERRNAAARKIGRGIREEADQRREILDLVGVEEAEPLVDIGGNAGAPRARSRTRDGWRASGRGSRCPRLWRRGRGRSACRGRSPRAGCARSRRPRPRRIHRNRRR